MTDQWLARIEEILWPNGPAQDVWMIVDGARTIEVFRTLLPCHLEYACLYSGPLSSELEIAAPYLVQLDYGYHDTHRLIRRAWGNSWGVFLKSDTSIEKVRRHLKEFLVVRDTKGNRLVFRYYDPRVLRIYLPTCLSGELRTLFGPIQVFWTEGQVPEDMLEFRFQRDSLVRRTLPLDSKGTTEPPALGSGQNLDSETPRRYTALTMRETQIAAFSRIEVQKFKDWMVVHLNKFFPRECQSAGETQLRETIQYGIKRAASYGISSRQDVCKYIDLMLVFGRDFDKETRFRWASEILGKGGDSGAKMRSLFREAKFHLRQG
jgi:Domain of unknown function (DUF4123)